MRQESRVFLVTLLLIVVAISARARQGSGDKKGEGQLRTVHGSVVDKGDNPVPSSIVYLENLKSQAVKTYISDDAGNYKFSGLDPNVDYEIHAEHESLQSSTRKISSFDSRRDIEITLHLSRQKPSH